MRTEINMINEIDDANGTGCGKPICLRSGKLLAKNLGQILGQNELWGTIWGNQMSVFVRICPKVNNAMMLKILQNIEFAELFFCMP